MNELLETGITAVHVLCFIVDAFIIYFMVFKGLPMLAQGIKNKVFSSFFLKAASIIVCITVIVICLVWMPFYYLINIRNNG